MKRRTFLKTTAAVSGAAGLSLLSPQVFGNPFAQDDAKDQACCDRTYASPAEAMKAPRETIAYVPAIYTGTGIDTQTMFRASDLVDLEGGRGVKFPILAPGTYAVALENER